MAIPPDADKDKDIGKLPIRGIFSNDELQTRFQTTVTGPKQKYFIKPHPGFEVVQLPDGSHSKLAYGELYDLDFPDIDIELGRIAKFEPKIKSKNHVKRKEAARKLKFHYKRAIALISPKYSKGWNRWSENILDLFLYDKLHRVLWGSGNCGKSVIMGLLLYIKWRVKPHLRMVVIATRVVTDSKARVFGYIKEIHSKAPASRDHVFTLTDGANNQGVFCMMFDEKTGKMIKNDRACIVSLPIKVKANKKGEISEMGSNLMGKHPDEQLILAFDEGQELNANLLQQKIFLNWLTNPNLEVHAWGNPNPVDYYDPTSHDLLFQLGTNGASLATIRTRGKNAERTDVWKTHDTIVLRLSMLDSPKDDPDETHNFVTDESGNKVQRLWFLGGKDSADRISEKTAPNSPEWHSQVLGFPFIDTQGSRGLGVITPFLVQSLQSYPLHWHTPERDLEFFMGVDPSISGNRDECSIAIARTGEMLDGRAGVDWVHGKYCLNVSPVEDEEKEEFADKTLQSMYRLSVELNIPLKNIAIETHGTAEIYRYAFKKCIENERNFPKWAEDAKKGQMFYVVSPSISPTERHLFKQLGKMVEASKMVADISTEYWVAWRCAVMTRQMFNMPDFILQQFYNRYLFTVGGAKPKFKLETKEDMAKRGLQSPNRADAACNVLEIMRRNGKFNFKFSDSAKYNPIYGEQQDQLKKQAKADRKLGIVSNVLGLGLRLQNGYIVSDAPKRKAFDVDLV